MTKNAWGVGLATIAADGAVLDTRFRALGWGDAVPTDAPHSSIDLAKSGDPERGVRFEPVRIVVDTTAAPQGASDVYLRLHLQAGPDQALRVHLLKRQGPRLDHPVDLPRAAPLHLLPVPTAPASQPLQHHVVDRPVPAPVAA